MSAVWSSWYGWVADGTGAELGWSDGAGPVSVVSVGTGVAGAVVAVPALGLSVGVAVGVAVGLTVGTAAVVVLDDAEACDVGVWAGVWDARWVGVLVGVGTREGDGDGVPRVGPPPMPAVPAVGTVANSPCS
jgi:hypothetical protein